MPSALMLCPEPPFPVRGGGAIRTASLATYLSRRYELDLVIFREPGAPDPREAIPGGFARRVDIIDLPHHGRSLGARYARNAARFLRGAPPLNDRFGGCGRRLSEMLRGRRYDATVVEHFWCAQYASRLAKHTDRLLLNLHNVESVLYGSSAAAGRWPVSAAMRRFEDRCRALEREWLPRYDVLLTASAEDAERVKGMAPASQVLVYPNALPRTPRPREAEQETIAFSGNLEYGPNVAAVRFFRKEVWPVLRAEHPGLTWILIGRNEQAVRKYVAGDPRVVVTGAVEDAVKALARARVIVVPLLSGSGTRLKILEAWAAARPVVSTPLGAEGLGATDGEDIVLASSSEAFARTVSRLLRQSCERERLGEGGRRRYEENFTWERAWAALSTAGI